MGKTASQVLGLYSQNFLRLSHDQSYSLQWFRPFYPKNVRSHKKSEEKLYRKMKRLKSFKLSSKGILSFRNERKIVGKFCDYHHWAWHNFQFGSSTNLQIYQHENAQNVSKKRKLKVPAKKDEKVLNKRKRVLADSKREIFPARLAGQIALPAEAFTHLLGSKLPRPHLASRSKATLRKLEAKWIIESFLKLEKWNFKIFPIVFTQTSQSKFGIS